MNVKSHSPLMLGRHSGSSALDPGWAHAHALVWMNVPLQRWACEAEGRIHLVRALDGADTEWRTVDLAANALRQLSASAAAELPSEVRQDLERWISRWRISFYRQPDLGLLSELGETRQAFTKRVTHQLRPFIQKRLREIDAQPLPRLPWRRHAAEQERRAEKQRLSAETALLAENIDTIVCSNIPDAVRSIELGPLYVPPGVHLKE